MRPDLKLIDKIGTDTRPWEPLDFKCTHYCNYCPHPGKGYSETAVLRGDPVPSYYAVWTCGITDLFCEDVPDDVIEAILSQARKHPSKAFIFCTKNPGRYALFLDQFPEWALLAATVESDIDHGWSKAPTPLERLEELEKLKRALTFLPGHHELCLSLAPLMKFTDDFSKIIQRIQPDQVTIGMELLGAEDFPTPEFPHVMKLARTLSESSLVQIYGNQILPDTELDDWPIEGYLCASNTREKYGYAPLEDVPWLY